MYDDDDDDDDDGNREFWGIGGGIMGDDTNKKA